MNLDYPPDRTYATPSRKLGLPEKSAMLLRKSLSAAPSEKLSTQSAQSDLLAIAGSQGRDGSPSRPFPGALGESALPKRKQLPHNVPSWVEPGAVFFITVCCRQRGSDTLTRPNVAEGLVQSAKCRVDLAQWWVHLLLLMPDHLHGLLSFPTTLGMRKVVTDWKRYTARALNIEWQRDFFDHRLRHDESFDEKAYYIRMNPVRAGLVGRFEDWPWVWTTADFGPSGRALSPRAPSGANAVPGAFGERALPSQGGDGSPSRPNGPNAPDGRLGEAFLPVSSPVKMIPAEKKLAAELDKTRARLDRRP